MLLTQRLIEKSLKSPEFRAQFPELKSFILEFDNRTAASKQKGGCGRCGLMKTVSTQFIGMLKSNNELAMKLKQYLKTPRLTIFNKSGKGRKIIYI